LIIIVIELEEKTTNQETHENCLAKSGFDEQGIALECEVRTLCQCFE